MFDRQSFVFLQMNDQCDINKLLRLEAHLKGSSCGVESPRLRDAKVNLLKFLQTGAVKTFERSYDDRVFELDKTGGFECLRNIVPVKSDVALAQKKGLDLQGLLAEASRAKSRLDDLVKVIVEECDGGCRHQEANVKSPESSQRKADKSYNGDVCRLTDMARASVICDKPEDLERAYSGIIKNFEVITHLGNVSGARFLAKLGLLQFLVNQLSRCCCPQGIHTDVSRAPLQV